MATTARIRRISWPASLVTGTPRLIIGSSRSRFPCVMPMHLSGLLYRHQAGRVAGLSS